MHKILIIKASGEQEEFDPQKVYHALMRSGAGEGLSGQITQAVAGRITPGMTTHQIFKLTFHLLAKARPRIAGRFDLKGALFRLGPSGHPFEQFVSQLLELEGYKTHTTQILLGRCVKHEVDVIAECAGERIMIECKFHNQPGTRCHIQTGLYTYARYLDLVEGREKFTEPWLVTNTKFTEDLVDYSQCRGLKLLGWHYPIGRCLEDLVNEHQLYPITMLSKLDARSRERLLGAEIVTTKQFLGLSDGEIKRRTGLSNEKIRESRSAAAAL